MNLADLAAIAMQKADRRDQKYKLDAPANRPYAAARPKQEQEPVKSAQTLARVARTPRPPYYAVTTTAELRPEFDKDEHVRLGTELYRHARESGGFLGLEAFYDGNASIAVSYWTDLEAIERWRRHPVHGAAKAKAKTSWFGATITRIARVESDYGFNLEDRSKGA